MKKSMLFPLVIVVALAGAAFTNRPTPTKLTTFYDEGDCSIVSSLPANCTTGTLVCTLSNGDEIRQDNCTTGNVVMKRIP